MMTVPKDRRGGNGDALNNCWIKIGHNDFILIRGQTMGLYCMYAILSNSWGRHLRKSLDGKMDF